MGTLLRKSWLKLRGKRSPEPKVEVSVAREASARVKLLDLDIAPDDPFLDILLASPGMVEIDRLKIDTPALRALKEQGVSLVAPLVSQGELIGILNLGPRLSEQEYSTDDWRLISNLATQAAPALRVAQLARQQQAEARERERLEQELRVARVIQQTLLPKELPHLPGWNISAHWQPARAVSGDFYDFISFPDGTIGLIVADVTDKGVPAALVMATTRSILRTVAERLVSPGKVLEQANELLCPDIPNKMFVTCLYALLDPKSGCMCFANAGHNLPYQRSGGGEVKELRATGMPLGLLPGMTYEEKETTLFPGDYVIMYSDGLVEAHNAEGEMFGFPRLRELLVNSGSGSATIENLLADLADFTGPDWVQEDDVTFVTLDRVETLMGQPTPKSSSSQAGGERSWQTIAEFEFPSRPGGERQAAEQVAQAYEDLGLSKEQMARLNTAVAETILNAMEHGNGFRPELMAKVKVLRCQDALAVRVIDFGGGKEIPTSQTPDLEAKLAGLQSPRGWGLFIIKNMVDEMNIVSDETHHTVELIMYLKGAGHGETTVSG